MRRTTLREQFATVEEAAHMAADACSLLASATNGASGMVDGGVVRDILTG